MLQIQGNPKLARTMVFWQALCKSTEVELTMLLWMKHGDESQTAEQKRISTEQQQQLQQLLEEFSGVFAEKKRLPPSRDVNHVISLKTGINPVNVRLYSYPHLQNSEIEKQVKEMLDNPT